jgi:pyridoxamine 5'-phosphate oxidase
VNDPTHREPTSPWELVSEWLPANDDPERPQMTLSTVTPAGEADARTVLLTEYNDDGFFFHTDAMSRKASNIVNNSSVALTFLWPGFTRQLVVQGRAEVAPAYEIASAYASRSPYLKQLAWQNTFEFAQLPDSERRARWTAFALEHRDGLAQPDTWIGFLVRPARMTFWTSAADAASRRLEYRESSGGWTRAYLPG